MYQSRSSIDNTNRIPMLLAIVFLISTCGDTFLACAQQVDTQSGNLPCESFSTYCENCLSSSSNCVFVEGLCSDIDCDGTEESGSTCYSTQTYPTLSAGQICEVHDADKNLCTSQVDCESCTSSIKSDGKSCHWYESVGSCFGGGCSGPFGCGTEICNAAEEDSLSPSTILTTESPIATQDDNTNISPDNGTYSYFYFDNLRFSGHPAKPMIEDPSHLGRNLFTIDETDQIMLCHIPTFFRWTNGAGGDVSNDAFGGSAAAILAMHHVNTGYGGIVKDLEGLPEKCNIRFTTELVDTESSEITAVKQLTGMVTRSPYNSLEQPQPCGVLGPSWSGVARKMASVTGVYDLLQVTSSASSVTLDDMVEYPLFARTHPSDEGFAQLSVSYLSEVLGTEFVGVLFVNNQFGVDYNEQVVKYARAANMTVKSEPIPYGATEDEVRVALLRLKATGYNHFIGVFYAQHYDTTMKVAGEMGMAGPGKLWVLSGLLAASFVNGKIDLPSNSSAARASSGHAIIHDEGGLPGFTQYDKFINEWKKYGDDSVWLDFVNSKLPTAPDGVSFERTSDYSYQTPSHIAAFSYDAVVGMALSACSAKANATAEDKFFSGSKHYEDFLKTTYVGASGEVVMGENSATRDSLSTYFVISNILGTPNVEGNVTSFHAEPWQYYDIDTQQWTRNEHGTLKDFIYSDGSTNAPKQIPDQVINFNYMSPGVRWTCVGLSLVAMALAMGFFVFTIVSRKNPVILASQPNFLMMICFGVLVMAASIIPFSIDDNIASERGCSVACALKFWMSSIGFCLVFSALFSKLWRISRVSRKSRATSELSLQLPIMF